jgi:hypothetical protein
MESVCGGKAQAEQDRRLLSVAAVVLYKISIFVEEKMAFYNQNMVTIF